MCAIGGPAWMHGVIVAAAGIGILMLGRDYWQILPGAVSGFVLVGPILATGLYALSTNLHHRRATGLSVAIAAWRRGTPRLILFGLLLVAAGTAWVAFSMLMFHAFVPAPIENPTDFAQYIATQAELQFLLWTIAGGLGSALLFAVTVVGVPMLYDRDVDMPTALLTSVRAVGENPYTMIAWALTIAFLTGLSIATFMIGFVVSYPLMGHASWHVYRDLVERSALPARH